LTPALQQVGVQNRGKPLPIAVKTALVNKLRPVELWLTTPFDKRKPQGGLASHN